MLVEEAWPSPSPAAAELIRAVIGRLLADPEPLLEAVAAAVLGARRTEQTADAEVTAAIRASNRVNMTHWAAATMEDPGARVAPYLGPETVTIAREIVRRGLDDTTLEAYRVAQNLVWQHYMRTAFALSDDHATLAEALEVSSRSIFTFIDDTLAALHAEMDNERALVADRTHTELAEVVNLILEGAPIAIERASRRLRYELEREHLAAIVWSEGVGMRDLGELEAAAEAVSRASGGGVPLTVVANASTLWTWFAAPAGAQAADLEAARRGARPPAGVRVALGTPGFGIDGFRRSHLQALTTQRLMRRMPDPAAFAAYAEVRLVALAAEDEARVGEFVTATLGRLARADPALRETVRTYAREDFSVARTARALFTHRNTVQGRLRRAETLLPVRLAGHGLEVGLALEIVHWLGPPAGRAG